MCEWTSERMMMQPNNGLPPPLHHMDVWMNEWSGWMDAKIYKIITNRFARAKSDEWCVVSHFSGIARTKRAPQCVQRHATHTLTHICQSTDASALVSHSFFLFRSLSLFLLRIFPSTAWFITQQKWKRARDSDNNSTRTREKWAPGLHFTREIDNNLMTFNYVEFFIFISDVCLFPFQFQRRCSDSQHHIHSA